MQPLLFFKKKVMRLNYFLIPLAVFLVAFVGSKFTSVGIDSGWYSLVSKPGWTPPGSLIGVVWTVIFTLTAASALIFWNKALKYGIFWKIAALFGSNAFLNVFWSYLFFYRRNMGWAVLEAGLLDATVWALIFMIWPISKRSSLLLLPYALWAAFAAYLNFVIWALN